MEPTGINLTDLYTTVGSVLGTPAALACFWVVSKIKELQTKVHVLETENSELKKDLGTIKENVSWIRGNMEGQSNSPVAVK